MADLTIITSTLPDAFVGDSYSIRVQARRGTLPYTWTATGLPDGLEIDSVTGEIRQTVTGVLAAQVGTYTPTITVTDNDSAVDIFTPELKVRPTNYLRRTTLLLDPKLQDQVNTFAASDTERERVTGHFAEGPRSGVTLGVDGPYEADVYAHWAGQIGYASGAPVSPSPGSPPAAPAAPSLYSVVEDLRDNQKVLAEPVIFDVVSYTSVESPATSVTVAGFDSTDPYLDGNLDIILSEHTDGPAYSSPDHSIGYPAVAQSITLPADAAIDALTVYASRTGAGQSGGINIAISAIAGSPADTLAIYGGANAGDLGSSPKVIATGYISPAQVQEEASRSAWNETYAVTVPLTNVNASSPGSSSPVILTGGEDYYLVFQSDYTLGSPDTYIRLAVTADETVTNAIQGSQPYIVTTGGALLSPVFVTNQNASPAQLVTAIAYDLEATWNSATVGVITIQAADPFNSPAFDRYWVGSGTAAQARTAFSLIDGYDRSSGSPVEDLTNWDEVVDAYGNQAQIIQANIVGGDEVNPDGGGQVDADGFLASGGITLRVAWTPDSRGSVPPVPFKIVAGRRRKLGDLEPDALIRTANKTGSTDANILSQLSDAAPSNPALSVAQVLPDGSGNIGLTVATDALGITKFPGSSTIQLGFLGTLTAEQLGGSATEVQFDASGTLTLLAGDFLTTTPTANQIRLDVDPGIATINSVAADGAHNLQITAGEDVAHAGQTFVTLGTGTNEVVVGTNIPDATPGNAGLFGPADKERLDALFSNSFAVSATNTAGVSGGHAHTADRLILDRGISGYLTLTAGMTLEDVITAFNTALAGQFNTATESGALSSLVESYAIPFESGYLSNGTGIAYSSPGFMPGDLVNLLVQGATFTTFTFSTPEFGDPGNAGTLGLEITDSSPWTLIEELDISQTYADAIAAIGGSPPNYNSVAAYMTANSVQPGGSPSDKVDLASVTYKGLDSTAAPVFELKVIARPTLGEFPNQLGYNKARMYHDTGSGINYTNEVELVKENYFGAADPTVNAAELSFDNASTIRYVSGIPHVVAPTNWGIYVDADNLYNITYQQTIANITDANDSTYNLSLPYYITSTASPQDATWIPSPAEVFTIGSAGDPYDLTEDMTRLVASDGYSSRGLTLEVQDAFFSDPGTTLDFADPYSSPYGRLLHLGRAGASVGDTTVETFASEKYRIDPSTWGGTDLVSPVASPVFTTFVTQPVAGGVLEANTYGWPSGTELTSLGSENTWNVTDGSDSAESRSIKAFAFNPGTRTSLPAQVSDMGLTHPGYNTVTEYNARTQMPALTSPFNVYGAYSSPYDYYTTYSGGDSVTYYRLFTSGTAANQGRLRVYGYLREAASPSLESYESFSEQLSSPHFSGSWYNVGPSASPAPTLSGITAEIKFVGDQSSVHAETPLGNPGKTGWLDMLTTGAASLYESGEDGYGVADTEGLTVGPGYVDIYWRAGAFSTGNTSNQAVVRLALHGDVGLRTVITRVEMLDQTTATPWSSGA